ncbi:hypothetical protein [Hyphobacterium sp.]|uniref:hypothetical protein n=1 Tax=Hyphobacterium sp. TaxID=2004662 RepID=UPI003BAD7F02
MPSRFEETDKRAIPDVKFTGPGSYLFWMTIFLGAVGVIGVLLIGPLETAFMANVAINGLILGVLFVGIIYTYLQALSIGPAARWLVRFRTTDDPASLPNPPSMIAPMASMIGDTGSRARMSAGSVRTVLDSVGARMSEAGAFTRYFGRLLIFLGLLGTFWGLLQVVSEVGEAVRAVTATATGGEADVLRLMSAIEEPIQGMGTAFASSLFGLAGSLVIGFLDLQASRAQNRFYNEIEEWLSSISRVAAAGPSTTSDGEMSPAYVGALLEQTAETLDRLAHTLEKHNRDLDTTMRRMAEESASGQQEAARALRDEIRVLVRAIEAQNRNRGN